jgi:predicted Zn-dependent protease
MFSGRLTSLAAAAAILLCAQAAAAQPVPSRAPAEAPGAENEIYGEFRVDESNAREKVPGSFTLILMTSMGKVVERRSVVPNSPFRFFALRNGNYDIVVESDGVPVARFTVALNSSRSVEARQDIRLEWVGGDAGGAKPGAISAADFYERGDANGQLFGRAHSAYKKKNYKDALPLLQQVVAADERDHIAWAYLGATHKSLGDAAESERCYRRALALRPDLLGAAINLGRMYALAESYDKVAEVLRPAVEKNPGSADATFLLGEAYLHTGKYEESAALFREALRLDPKGKSEAHLRLAAVLNAAGRKEEAAAEVKQFLVKNPNHPKREMFEEYVRQNRKR